jgi:hypothetical protein
VNDVVRTHLPGERESRVVHVRGDDARRAGGLADPDGENADRAASGDEHRCAGDLGREHRVKRVAHRIVNAADVERDRVVEVPHVRRRHGDVLGEAAVAIDADDARVGADVRIARAAEQAAAVDDVPFGGHAIAGVHVGDEPSDLDDFAGELVADDDRRLHAALCPRIPVVNVHVGAAHAGAPHPNEHFVFSDCRLGNVAEFEPRSRRWFHQRFHARVAPLRLCVDIMRTRFASSSMRYRARNVAPTSDRWKCDASACLLRAV